MGSTHFWLVCFDEDGEISNATRYAEEVHARNAQDSQSRLWGAVSRVVPADSVHEALEQVVA